MKKSSIEWLIEHLTEYGFDLSCHQLEINQAKEMHKQEVIDAYDKGDENGANRVYYNSDRDDKSAEQYHNETYNIKR